MSTADRLAFYGFGPAAPTKAEQAVEGKTEKKTQRPKGNRAQRRRGVSKGANRIRPTR